MNTWGVGETCNICFGVITAKDAVHAQHTIKPDGTQTATWWHQTCWEVLDQRTSAEPVDTAGV